jgi:glycosyltransferase involved in cell wall biosynthesis
MNIAIDVHSIGSGGGGNETFYRQLVRGLIANQEDHRYYLFYTHAIAREEYSGDGRFRFIAVAQNPLLRNCVSIPRWLNKLQPDAFHCQYVKPPFVHCPTVVTIHDISHEHFPQHFHPLYAFRQRELVRGAARRAEHILTVSEFAALDIKQTYGVARDRITVAYQAPAEIFCPREKRESQQRLGARYGIEPPFLLYIGRLNPRKNLLRLVEAYAAARRRGVTANLVLAGPQDWQSKELFARINALRIEANVLTPGYVPHSDLPLFLCASEAFIFPSLFEGFGLPVVESMACGVPVITSRGSSLEEIAGDGALLIDPNSVESISSAIVRLLGDSALRDDLATRGLRRSAQFRRQELPEKALHSYRRAIEAAKR